MLENLVGKRYKTLEEIKKDIETITDGKVNTIIESESERPDGTDFMIDFEFERVLYPFRVTRIYTIFYLKDNADNYYITEV